VTCQVMSSPDEKGGANNDDAIHLSPTAPRQGGFRQAMKHHHEKERVIRYMSPTKHREAGTLRHLLEGVSPQMMTPSVDEDQPDDGSLSAASIKDRHPQMVIKKLKPLKEDFMSYFGAQNSVSQLSFNVNDAAGGKSFESCYEKRDVLGEGGFAVVYRCFHFERLYTYAVKEILKDEYECSGENLREEIDSLKRLQDIPYIVRLMDVFHEQNVCYLVMEEMKGGDLLERLGEIEVFNEVDGRTVCRRLLEAVFYCHKKHVCHRDIKPENVLMSSRENNTSIKLADFGCSRKFEPGTSKLLTLCGSPQYVAPELYTHGGSGYDERCDLWSAAVVMYVILGGYAPFDGDDHELPGIICQGHFEFHEDYWAEVSEPPKDVIRSLLQVDPRKRASLAEALDSEWLRRRDRDKLENSKNLDGGSLTSFEAWCKSQHSDASGSIVDTMHSNSRRPTLDLLVENADSSENADISLDDSIGSYDLAI
jgi:serine/threonine protein kinase